MSKLIIVESPTKANTIKRYLSNDYKVIASVGHVRDLATSGKGGYGVNLEKDFEPTYKIIPNKYKVVNQIKKEAKNREVIIATDPDREGEAIAWHIAEILKLDPKDNIRIRFNEITKKAVLEALEKPEPIDMNLVLSQETRKTLDRIIGFDLSKLVQRKLYSTSAGRVQSATLRMIYERELEIRAFKEEAYYLVFADFKDFKAAYEKNGVNQKDKDLALKVVEKAGKDFIVKEIITEETERFSSFPYTTSKLQQDGIRKLSMSATYVMSTAQKLYEGVQIGDEV
ncbi:MAG: DNA topoisomerase, partial [Acholeplasmatales bacterium]